MLLLWAPEKFSSEARGEGQNGPLKTKAAPCVPMIVVPELRVHLN
jgi:hypothetical protein